MEKGAPSKLLSERKPPKLGSLSILLYCMGYGG
jgi:hypothetical protein